MKDKLISLMVVVVIAGMFFMFVTCTFPKVEGGQPAIVNPTGWDKPTICAKLQTLIDTANQKKSVASCANKLMSMVCELPPAIYNDLRSTILSNTGGDEDQTTLILIKGECLLYKINITLK